MEFATDDENGSPLLRAMEGDVMAEASSAQWIPGFVPPLASPHSPGSPTSFGMVGSVPLKSRKKESLIKEGTGDKLLDVDLGDDKLRLLYLISLYTSTAEVGLEKPQERWIRLIPVLVLVYEGIISEVFDYDYAPQADLVGSKRVYLNVSQEGRDDIDDLREIGMVLALKLTSKTYTSTMALRISPLGARYLAKHLLQEHKDAVHKVVHAPGSAGEELVTVCWDPEEENFRLVDDTVGYKKISTITDIEAVSYVSSPYIAAPLRQWGRATSSSADRVDEIDGSKGSTIKDNLSENILLDEVHIMICEWIPMGGNQIVALNDRLGSSERVQGGFFTSRIDENPEDTQLAGNSEGLTSCNVLDFDETAYVNFEAEVYFPTDDGIEQVESFGVHFSEAGTVIYGMRLDAIMDRVKNKLSLDLISRLLVDILDDSSELADNLLSGHQRSILDCIFMGDAGNRDKYNVIFADRIHPKLPSEKYMDKEDNENELKQVIGDTHSGHDLSAEEVLIQGRNGILLAGPNARRHEPMLLAFVSLQTRNTFMRSVFYRTFILADVLKSTRELIETFEENPNNITSIREWLSISTEDIITLAEVQEFLVESISNFQIPDPTKGDEASETLAKILDIYNLHRRLKLRSVDMQKTVEGVKNELAALCEMAEVISDSATLRTQEGLMANTKNLEDCFRAGQRASQSLEVMQVVLAGSLAFGIVDRATGQYLGLDPSLLDWTNRWILPIQQVPGGWLGVNMLVWIAFGALLIWFMRHLEHMSSSVDAMKMRLNRSVDLKNLHRFLKTRELTTQDSDLQKSSFQRRYAWEETDAVLWKGQPPKVEMIVDERYSYILQVFIESNKRRNKMKANEVKATFFRLLESFGVWTGSDEEAEVAIYGMPPEQLAQAG